jgi:integrase
MKSMVEWVQDALDEATQIPMMKTGEVLPLQSYCDACASLKHLQGIIGDKAPNDVTVADVKRLVGYLKDKGLKNISINTHLSRLAARVEDLRRTKCKGVRVVECNVFSARELGAYLPTEAHTIKSHYTENEENAIFHALKQPLAVLPQWKQRAKKAKVGAHIPEAKREELRIFCELLSRTGLRRVSIYEDTKVSEDGILRYPARKGGRSVAIPMDDALKEVMEFFDLQGGWTMPQDWYSRVVRAICGSLGIQIRQPLHGFRHTLFSRLRDTAGETVAKDIVGHAVQGIAKAYTHETEGRALSLKVALDKINHPR